MFLNRMNNGFPSFNWIVLPM